MGSSFPSQHQMYRGSPRLQRGGRLYTWVSWTPRCFFPAIHLQPVWNVSTVNMILLFMDWYHLELHKNLYMQNATYI